MLFLFPPARGKKSTLSAVRLVWVSCRYWYYHWNQTAMTMSGVIAEWQVVSLSCDIHSNLAFDTDALSLFYYTISSFF